MSYETIASLLFGKRPFFLYEFTSGAETWRFTSLNKTWETEVDAAILTWEPRAISHARVPHTAHSARSDFPITLPLSDGFARRFLAPTGRRSTRVVVYKGFENDPDAELVTCYMGRVVQATPSDKAGTIDLICNTALSALDRKALIGVMQRPCRHVVYAPNGGCRLDLSVHQVSMQANGSTGVTLNVPDAGNYPDGYYSGGIIEFEGEIEIVESHIGTTLVLAAEIEQATLEILTTGFASVQVARGCDQSFPTCRDVFGNDDNYGGFDYIKGSPFDGRSIS